MLLFRARVCFLCLLTESKSFLASSKIQHRAKVESDYIERIEDASKRKKRGVLHHLFRVATSNFETLNTTEREKEKEKKRAKKKALYLAFSLHTQKRPKRRRRRRPRRRRRRALSLPVVWYHHHRARKKKAKQKTGRPPKRTNTTNTNTTIEWDRIKVFILERAFWNAFCGRETSRTQS